MSAKFAEFDGPDETICGKKNKDWLKPLIPEAIEINQKSLTQWLEHCAELLEPQAVNNGRA